ncbi:MAG: DUF1800 family protein [Proteobacteria bacterium]|nr:DUF1800 family protein [Pseudomonadota bacterium]
MKTSAWVVAIFLLAGTASVHATVHDQLFKGTFDIPADAPTSAADAARFLTQATFGPTPADINYLMAQGYSEWIDEQLAKPVTLAEPTVEAVVFARTNGGLSVGQTQRLNRTYWQFAYAPDQLRQRMAFALSQIFVVSDQSSAISQDVVPMAHYQDLLANDAFGYYSTLLNDVTYSPTMGKYLNTYHNVAPVCSGSGSNKVCSTSPDENYAREVMQLFSVGLIMLNMDHSPVLSGGLPVPTYDQTIITHTAQVFTGFTYSNAPTNPANFYYTPTDYAGQYNPMACWGTELFSANNPNMKHDVNGDDEVFGVPLTVLGPSGVGSVTSINAATDCSIEIGAEMVAIASHPNVAPFISRQLIQRFVTSNPSPAYIQRVATVFDTAGNDLGDVIKAILTDTEARNPPALASGDSYGKLREPVLRLTAMWRAFNAKAPAPDAYGEVKMIAYGGFQGGFGQSPLESPTVFNFYLPDYQQPGTFADNGLYSPEFQITNTSTTYTSSNIYYWFTAQGYQGYTTGTPAAPPVDRPLIDLSSLTANAANPTAMVSTINASMMYGAMSAAMNTRLTTMLNEMKSGGTSPTEMAWSAIYVTMLSPEYSVQR